MENEEYEKEERRIGYQFKRELALVVVLAAPMVLGMAWAVGTTVSDAIHDVSDRATNNARELVACQEYRRAHEREAVSIDRRLSLLEDIVRSIEHDIDAHLGERKKP